MVEQRFVEKAGQPGHIKKPPGLTVVFMPF